MNDLKDLATGELNIGVTFTFSPLLTETVLDFMKRYPGVRLNIIYKTMAELYGYATTTRSRLCFGI